MRASTLYRLQVLSAGGDWVEWWHSCAGSFLVWDTLEAATKDQHLLLDRALDGLTGQPRYLGVRIIDAHTEEEVQPCV